jgi:hypothetical protein
VDAFRYLSSSDPPHIHLFANQILFFIPVCGIIIFVGESMVLKLILHGLFDDSAEEIDLEDMMISALKSGPVRFFAPRDMDRDLDRSTKVPMHQKTGLDRSKTAKNRS